jgi:hypothetical protein
MGEGHLKAFRVRGVFILEPLKLSICLFQRTLNAHKIRRALARQKRWLSWRAASSRCDRRPASAVPRLKLSGDLLLSFFPTAHHLVVGESHAYEDDLPFA